MKMLTEMPRKIELRELHNPQDFIIHTNQHLDSIHFLLARVEEYLTQGLPRLHDFEQPSPHEFHESVSQSELLEGLGIDAQAVEQNGIGDFLRLMRAYFLHHDQAKWDTSDTFYHFVDQRHEEFGLAPEERYFIDGIRNPLAPDLIAVLSVGAGLNPWEVDERLHKLNGDVSALSPQDQALVLLRQSIQKMNKIDHHLGEIFFLRTDIPTWLRRDWVKDFLQNLERNLDSLERGMNPLSPQEFGRKMFRQSQFRVKEGKVLPLDHFDYFRALNLRLENDYHARIREGQNDFFIYRRNTALFFNALNRLGLTNEVLDPDKKNILITLMQRENRQPLQFNFDESQLANMIFCEFEGFILKDLLNANYANAREAFKAAKLKWLLRGRTRALCRVVSSHCEHFLLPNKRTPKHHSLFRALPRPQ